MEYPANYELLFMAAAAALFCGSLGFLAIKEKPIANRFESSSILEMIKFIPGYLKEDANLRNFIIINNLSGFATTLLPFYVVLARDTYSLEVADIGNFLLVQIFGMISSNLLWSRIVQRHAFKGVLFSWVTIGSVLPLLALVITAFAPEKLFSLGFLF